jgi:hypothetical protein
MLIHTTTQNSRKAPTKKAAAPHDSSIVARTRRPTAASWGLRVSPLSRSGTRCLTNRHSAKKAEGYYNVALPAQVDEYLRCVLLALSDRHAALA